MPNPKQVFKTYEITQNKWGSKNCALKAQWELSGRQNYFCPGEDEGSLTEVTKAESWRLRMSWVEKKVYLGKGTSSIQSRKNSLSV